MVVDTIAPSNTISTRRFCGSRTPSPVATSGWALTGSRAGDHYVTFQKAQRRCIGFVRNGSGSPGQLNWILGAVFCRESATPIPTSEAEFVADAVKVRD